MKKEVKWVICIFSFLYFIDLAIALKIKDVQITGPNHVEIGLSSVNSWFRDLWHYDSTAEFSFFVITFPWCLE